MLGGREKKLNLHTDRQIERYRETRHLEFSDYKNLPRIPLKDHKLCSSSVVIFVLFFLKQIFQKVRIIFIDENGDDGHDED